MLEAEKSSESSRVVGGAGRACTFKWSGQIGAPFEV